MSRMAPPVLTVGLALVCATALAGDLRCLITARGGLQEGVEVQVWSAEGVAQPTRSRRMIGLRKERLRPANVTGTDGMCTFRGLAAGEYRVTAEKTVEGQLRGAVRDVVIVPATGRVDVRLMIKRALRIHEYVPRKAGSKWRYVSDPESTEPSSIWECHGPTEFNDQRVMELRRRTPIRGHDGWYRVTLTSFETSSDDGWRFYGAEHAQDPITGDIPIDTYRTPVVIPDLWPEGHTYTLSPRLAGRRDPDDSILSPTTKEYTLAGFGDIRTPAGFFRDCARISHVFRRYEDTVGVGVMYLAKGVGEVYGETTVPLFGSAHKHLLSYEIPGDPAMPAVRLLSPRERPPRRVDTILAPRRRSPR